MTMGADGTRLAHALYNETGGNPFFVGELLRHLAETGVIAQQDDGRWVATVGSRSGRSAPERP